MPVQPIQRRSARILFDTEVLDDGWHPLDGIPAPEYIPPRWISDAGKRLVEGLRTLRLMPRVAGPQAWGSAWPEYAHDWADMIAQQEADEADKQRAQYEQNRTRLRPSSVEISRMEQSIAWPMRYLREFPQLVRTVQMVAVARSRDRDLEHAARRLRLPGHLVRRWNHDGLDLVARGLIRDRIRIF
jgi:hypothetical protein